MAKRQKRFNKLELNSEILSNISSEKVNIVFNDHTTMLVKIEYVANNYIEVSNMSLSKSKITINDIFEIILDY